MPSNQAIIDSCLTLKPDLIAIYRFGISDSIYAREGSKEKKY